MSSEEPVIQLNNVWKKYSRAAVFHRSLREEIAYLTKGKRKQPELANNEFWALQGIDFTVRKGETIGLYGPNGAGKSTILKLIGNITPPTRGTVRVTGRVAPLLEIGAGFHLDLTGRENIFVNGAILGMRIKEIKDKLDTIINFAGIRDFIDMPVKKYSSGMIVRLAFSIAIQSEAHIYLMDEIIAVGDEHFQKKCLDKIRELKASDKTIVMVAHSRLLLEQFSDRIMPLNNGAIVQ